MVLTYEWGYAIMGIAPQVMGMETLQFKKGVLFMQVKPKVRPSVSTEVRENVYGVENWRVKVFDMSELTSGKWYAMNASCGATRLETTGKWVGGMRLRLMVEKAQADACPDAPSDVYMVSGHISFKATEMPDGRVYTTPTIWCDKIAPYIPRPKVAPVETDGLVDVDDLIGKNPVETTLDEMLALAKDVSEQDKPVCVEIDDETGD